ncbi:MAG: LysM peptidoglycan-binding domain-containing protein [Verrucomicrobia bacterium]|nr:MAG: LysM peptidoglycan-binding domain-containing protein [Verrucomicrobiota bacterium]
MKFHHRNRALLLAPVLLAGGFAGCVTTQDYQTKLDAQAQENARLLQEQTGKLVGRVEALEVENQKLNNDIAALRANQSRAAAGATDTQALRAELGDFDRRIRTMEAGREKDKQELVDTLSRKISQIMGGAPVDSGSKRRKSSSGESHSSGGGDYVVKSGDSLSKIASAHGITLAALMEANGIKNSNQIRVGQKLVIPK